MAQRFFIVGAVVLVGILGVGATALAASDPGDDALAQTCIASGLATPPVLKGHFELQSTTVHPKTTDPKALIRILLPAMPSECSDRYQRIVKVCIRYKTTLRPWKSVTTTLLDGRRPRCAVIDSFNYGTYGRVNYREVGDTGYFYDFGRVTRVKGRTRLIVKDESSGLVAAQRSLKLPMTFSAKRKMLF